MGPIKWIWEEIGSLQTAPVRTRRGAVALRITRFGQAAATGRAENTAAELLVNGTHNPSRTKLSIALLHFVRISRISLRARKRDPGH